MARTYIYTGEAESVVPFTLDGPRVVSAGDEVTLADDDASFEGHPLFERKGGTPALRVVSDGDTQPVIEPEHVSDPEQPESQEPTA